MYDSSSPFVWLLFSLCMTHLLPLYDSSSPFVWLLFSLCMTPLLPAGMDLNCLYYSEEKATFQVDAFVILFLDGKAKNIWFQRFSNKFYKALPSRLDPTTTATSSGVKAHWDITNTLQAVELQGKCCVKYIDDIKSLDEYNKKQDCFYYTQVCHTEHFPLSVVISVVMGGY